MAVILQPLGAFFRLTPLRNEWQDVELNTPLDALYLNGDKSAFKHALKAFKKDGGLKGYSLASHESIDKVMDEIAQLDPGQISPSLYESYSENLRKAVDQVFKKDNGNGLSDQLRANVSKFAAYKAYNATIDIQREMGNDWDDAKMVLRTYNRYQTTEYNTTVSRCRTAKQFEQFNDPDNRRLFPNLRWLPSRSADPRESHKLFWDRVWSKDDSFWLENTPGSLWNCKCDWEETDDPVTDGNPSGDASKTGLKGNPSKTGNVFSDDHPYFDNRMWDYVKSGVRYLTRDKASNLSKTLHIKDFGDVLVDNISYIEVTKGASSDEAYFLKIEMLKNVRLYANKLRFVRSEAIDLSHNNNKNVFYKRKKSFDSMEVYDIEIKSRLFVFKFGKFKNSGKLHLYTITG